MDGARKVIISNVTKAIQNEANISSCKPINWRNRGLQFLSELKEKYNLNTPEDWNSLSIKQIHSNGGSSLLTKYSLYDLKCMACPEGKSIFSNSKPVGYWENKENVHKFLSELKEKYNLNTPEDWNSIIQQDIKSNGGHVILQKYSMFELKCMACPEGKSIFKNPKQVVGYWENQENIQQFLSEIKTKYNLNTPDDWNSINYKHIKFNGGSVLLRKYSMFEIKCMACPEGKSIFNDPKQVINKENINSFFLKLKEKYNLNTPDDWNSLSIKQIHSNGGGSLLQKYSMFEIKCMACPEGKSIFNVELKSSMYWENKENVKKFILELQQKHNLNTPEDWKRISKRQIHDLGGWGFLKKDYLNNVTIQFENSNKSIESIPLKKLISATVHKRSSQRWLFLQIQKLFPGEEIVEDYFHSEISRLSGANIQFDIFMIERNVAIEYHGKQHYEDIPYAFSNLDTYKSRDLEKENLCKEHGIQMIVIPYWWDNNIDSLRSFLYSKINKSP